MYSEKVATSGGSIMNHDPNHEASAQSNIERFIVGHFEGNLDADQERQLAAAISTSTESKALFLSHMRIEGRLHSMGRDGLLFAEDTQPRGGRVNAMTVTPTKPKCSIEPLQSAASTLGIRRSKYRQRSRVWVASSSVAVCCMLIAIVCWGLWPSPVNAGSVLRKAQQAAEELIDRTYRITISRSEDQSRPRELMMNLGGGGRFIIQPAGGAYVMGHDGSDFWVTQRNGPVWVTSDFRRLASQLRKRMPEGRLLELATSPDEPLLLGIAELLSLIERKYDLEIVASDTVKEHHVRATVNSSRPNYPEVIDLWSDAESGVVLRIEARFANGRKRQFELIETAKLSEQWYHYSEHAPGKKVERIHTAN
ncbi:hypothetical protein N9B68_01075 [bacterium]|nr:hypothetical protein [bacterium]